VEARLIDLRSQSNRRVARAIGIAGLMASVISWPGTAWCWETAHGPTDNTGFVNVPTAPAKAPMAGVTIGNVASGAGPVVAPDGTVYIGTKDGKLMSLEPRRRRQPVDPGIARDRL
jgi:hypothetical protein